MKNNNFLLNKFETRKYSVHIYITWVIKQNICLTLRFYCERTEEKKRYNIRLLDITIGISKQTIDLIAFDKSYTLRVHTRSVWFLRL